MVINHRNSHTTEDLHHRGIMDPHLLRAMEDHHLKGTLPRTASRTISIAFVL